MKHFVSLLFILFPVLLSCAVVNVTRQEIIALEETERRACYVYGKRDDYTISGDPRPFFPMLPIECGITYAEALKKSAEMAFYTRKWEMMFSQVNDKKTMNTVTKRLTISSTPIPGDDDKCMIIRLKGYRLLPESYDTKRYVAYIELCEGPDNELFIKRDVPTDEGEPLYQKLLRKGNPYVEGVGGE